MHHAARAGDECQNPDGPTARRRGGRIGVREDKKRDTRARLERAALELFAGRGYERTTVEDVAARAGVSARTAFRYFPAKADLVFGDAGPDLEALRGHLAAQDRSIPAIEATRAALGEFSLRIGTPINAERTRVVAASPTLTARALEVRELWAEAIAAELAARRKLEAPDERARLGGLLIVAILVSAVREWSNSDGHPRALRQAVDRTALWAVEILRP
ncbi:MAG: helix-turn-helix domain-containing protein [Solirubrobacterales bacterium]